MFELSLLVSVFLLVVANFAVRRQEYPAVTAFFACVVCGLGSLCLMVALPAVMLQAALMVVALLVLLVPRRGRKPYLPVSVAVTVIAWAVVIHGIWAELDRHAELRAKYPFESLDDRLPPRPAVGGPTNPNRLNQYEEAVENETYLFSSRTQTLKALHEDRVSQFTRSAGFGVGRMAREPSEWALNRHRKETVVPQPGKPRDPAAGSPDPNTSGRTDPATVSPSSGATDTDFSSLHQSGVVDFANPGGFGLIREKKVAGFQPHGMTQVPASKDGWTVRSIELVGLLRHEKPVVYESANLPRMDELKGAPTRPLSAFETDALASLHRGEDFVVRPDEEGLRMVGAVRAAKQCLACHEGNRGALLGAFSYTLRREK